VRESPPQTGLARAERLASPRGTYGPARSAAGLRGATALLVDDVLTTGATAAECSRLLLDAGAGDVIVAVAARTPARGAHARSEAGSIGGSVEID
jgi:predicted amidophosphoribosyltransferase